MIPISLEDFLRNGAFGPIQLGLARAQVRALFGRPQYTSTIMDNHGRPIMWKYGDIELIFDPDEKGLIGVNLEMPTLAAPSGWRRIVLDPWVLRAGVPPEEIERALQGADISYKYLPARHPGDYLVLETASHVQLGFIREEEDHRPPRGLHYAELMDWSKR